jgi:hypothetical protein
MDAKFVSNNWQHRRRDRTHAGCFDHRPARDINHMIHTAVSGLADSVQLSLSSLAHWSVIDSSRVIEISELCVVQDSPEVLPASDAGAAAVPCQRPLSLSAASAATIRR